MATVASAWEQLCPLNSYQSALCMPAPIVNTAQAWKGGAGLLQWQVETVLLWVPPAPPGVSFLLVVIRTWIQILQPDFFLAHINTEQRTIFQESIFQVLHVLTTFLAPLNLTSNF